MVMGWVGGGCAESAVRAEALKCIEQEKPQLITLDMQDELLGVGMPCGGLMDVYIEPVLPKPELLIVGHGRIAEALASLGTLLNFFVTVNDPAAEKQAFPTADRLVREDFDLSETPIDSRTFVVIATLHKNDHVWLQKALENEAAYVALIASAHRARLVLDYLLVAGAPAEKVERVWAPAGGSWRGHSGGNCIEHHEPDRRSPPWRRRQSSEIGKGSLRGSLNCRDKASLELLNNLP